MRTQQERDEQTVAIGTAVGLFAVILPAVWLVTMLVHSLTYALDGYGEAVLGSALLVSGLVACTYLARSTRR